MNRLTIAVMAIFTFFAGCQDTPLRSAGRGRSLSVPFRQSTWQTGFVDGERITTAHYRIYTTVRRQDLLAALPGFLEACHANYRRLTGLGGQEDRALPMYMLGTREEWAALTESKFGRHAAPSIMIENGAYTYEGIMVCWDIGGTATLSVTAHEGMHQFLHNRLAQRLPLWAEEGLATTAEAFVLQGDRIRFQPDRNLMRLANLRRAMLHEKWLPVEKLLTTGTLEIAPGGEIETLGYYGQLYVLMSFLRSRADYREGLSAMLTDARDGRLVLPSKANGLSGMTYHRVVGRPLFEHYISNDLEAFERQFRRYARRFAQLQESPG